MFYLTMHSTHLISDYIGVGHIHSETGNSLPPLNGLLFSVDKIIYGLRYTGHEALV